MSWPGIPGWETGTTRVSQPGQISISVVVLYAAPQQFLLHKLLYYESFVTQFVCTNIILIQNILRSVLIFASKYFTYYFVYKLLLQNYGHIYEVVVPQFHH